MLISLSMLCASHQNKFCVVTIRPPDPRKVSVVITTYDSGSKRSIISRFKIEPNWRARSVAIDPGSKWIAITLDNPIENANSVWCLDRKTGERIATYRYRPSEFYDGLWTAAGSFTLFRRSEHSLKGIDLQVYNRAIRVKSQDFYPPLIRNFKEASLALSARNLHWPVTDANPVGEFQAGHISDISSDGGPIISKNRDMVAAYCRTGEADRPLSLVLLSKRSGEWIRKDVTHLYPHRMVFLNRCLSYMVYEMANWRVRVIDVDTGKYLLEIQKCHIFDACDLQA